VVNQSQAPEYVSAAWGLLGGYAAKTVGHGMLLVGLWWANRRRDRKYGPVDERGRERAKEAGMRGETEWENKDFRYVL
jgi:hypothetical protein